MNESYDGSDNDEMEMESDSKERNPKINKYADDDEMVPEIYDPDDVHGSASGNLFKLYIYFLFFHHYLLYLVSRSAHKIDKIILY